MYEHGPSDGFDTIAEEDRAAATRLSDSFLPKYPQPEASTPTDGPVRTYTWDSSKADSDELYTVHQEVAGDGLDRLIGRKITHNHGEDTIWLTSYQLFVDTGWFVVQREVLTDEDIQEQFETEYAEAAQESQTDVAIELEAGLLEPGENDWPDFMDMLRAGSEHHLQAEVEAGIAELSDLLALEGSFEQ